MSHTNAGHPSPETVPLQNAVLCVDCELVTASHSDVCPVCGGHSLLALASIIGGSVVDYKAHKFRNQQFLLFELEISIAISQIEAGELSTVIENISRVIGPKLGRNTASLHINVQPVATSQRAKLKAA